MILQLSNKITVNLEPQLSNFSIDLLNIALKIDILNLTNSRDKTNTNLNLSNQI